MELVFEKYYRWQQYSIRPRSPAVIYHPKPLPALPM